MDKNYYSYSIEAIENGYILNASYYSKNTDPERDYMYYKNDKFVFIKFDEVLDFMKDKPLVSPPIKN